MPTNETISSGNWSNPSIWSLGHVPTTNEDVVINEEHTVNFDLTSTNINSLQVKGSLFFPTEFPSGTFGYEITVNGNSSNPSTGIIDYQSISNPQDFVFPLVILRCSSGTWDLSSLTVLFDNFHDTFPVTKHGKWTNLGFTKGGWFGVVSNVSESGGQTILTVTLPPDADADNYLSFLSQRSNGSVEVPLFVSPPRIFLSGTISSSGGNFVVVVNGTGLNISVGSLLFPIPPVPILLENVRVRPRSDGIFGFSGTNELSSPKLFFINLWNGRVKDIVVQSKIVSLFGNSQTSVQGEKGLFCPVPSPTDFPQSYVFKEVFVGVTEFPMGVTAADECRSLFSSLNIEVPTYTLVRFGKFYGNLRLSYPLGGEITKFEGNLDPSSALFEGTTFTVGGDLEPSQISTTTFSSFFSSHATSGSHGTLVLKNVQFSDGTINLALLRSNGYFIKRGTTNVGDIVFPAGEIFVPRQTSVHFLLPTKKKYFSVGTNTTSSADVILTGKTSTIVKWKGELRWYFVEASEERVSIIVNNPTADELTLPLINPKEFSENEVGSWGIEESDQISPLVGHILPAPTNETDYPFIEISNPYKVVSIRGRSSVPSGVSVSVVSSDGRTLLSQTLTDADIWFGYINPAGNEKLIVPPAAGEVWIDLHSLKLNYHPNYERVTQLFSGTGFDEVSPNFSILPAEGYFVYMVGSLSSLVSAANFLSYQQTQLSREGVYLTPTLSTKINLRKFIQTFLREINPNYPFRVFIDDEKGEISVEIFCATSEPTVSELSTVINAMKRLLMVLKRIHPPSENWSFKLFPIHRFP